MKTYEQLVEEYRKRQHDTVVDTIATWYIDFQSLSITAAAIESLDEK